MANEKHCFWACIFTLSGSFIASPIFHSILAHSIEIRCALPLTQKAISVDSILETKRPQVVMRRHGGNLYPLKALIKVKDKTMAPEDNVKIALFEALSVDSFCINKALPLLPKESVFGFFKLKIFIGVCLIICHFLKSTKVFNVVKRFMVKGFYLRPPILTLAFRMPLARPKDFYAGIFGHSLVPCLVCLKLPKISLLPYCYRTIAKNGVRMSNTKNRD